MKTGFSLKRTTVVAALAAALGGTYLARVAYTADLRLAEADAALQKALALLEAADTSPGGPRCERPLLRAIELLEKVRIKIANTQICVDESLP
ncbi:MAG: hypothetical protein ACRERD_13360 [Candidatus Binatia bacterium]